MKLLRGFSSAGKHFGAAPAGGADLLRCSGGYARLSAYQRLAFVLLSALPAMDSL